ncbi:cell division suppressor protein YneA [Pseudobutyrivibrio sp.]|uniref:cell division suppressor protein YneA n=1 Tax=Pseudobutyrivibrio sp. TaxID=2014367 RepID=UPI001B5E8387|nr:LysM peptidoglycan-binding domain-containing protein [Pseudobutyrivibrio sp.]MBP5594414.1 LysM peptidoglycan-binding domain-containing protein [Pseudobutyrivibrio sp.]MBR5648496.1 LysM peptidoglycan-binding domain-containing protein [Pseudobutyrivibrio sp.]
MRAVTKAELIVKRRKMMLFAGILAALIIGMISFSINASAEDSREVYTYYTSYEVQAGDTLWTIADQFMGPDFTNKTDFIANVKKMNHLSSDSITAGNYLIIEYSSYDKL